MRGKDRRQEEGKQTEASWALARIGKGEREREERAAKEGTRMSGVDHGARVARASERRGKGQGQDAFGRSPPDQ